MSAGRPRPVPDGQREGGRLNAAAAAAIPAYQAGPSVGDVVRGCLAHTGPGGCLGEVLVVDDGSTDDTRAAAAGAGARVVRHPSNRGKGRALRTAFEDLFARGFAHVVTLDADGQHLPVELPRLLAFAAGAEADLVIGTRAHLFADMSGVRRASNGTSTFLIATVAGQALRDVQSGFRVYSRRLIHACGFPEPGFEAESAVVVRAVRCGFRVRELPVRLGFADGRTTSHYRPVIDSLRIALAVARARLEVVGCPVQRSW